MEIEGSGELFNTVNTRPNSYHSTLVFRQNLGLDQNHAVVSCFRGLLKQSGTQMSLLCRFQTLRNPVLQHALSFGGSQKTPHWFFFQETHCPPSQTIIFQYLFQFLLQNCEAMPWLFLLVHPPASSDSRLADCCAGVFFKHHLPGESSPASQWAVGREI